MAEPRIDVDGLPLGVSGPYDTVVGVDEATGDARRFPMPQPGTPRSYATRASLPAASGFAEGYTVWVNNDPTPANNGTWAVLGGVWVQSADRVSGLESRVSKTEAFEADLDAYALDLEVGKNLYNPAADRPGKNIQSNAVIANHADTTISGFIRVTPGQTYTLSHAGLRQDRAAFFSSASDSAGVLAVAGSANPLTVTAPPGANFFAFNIYTSPAARPANIQFEEGLVVTPYDPYLAPRRTVNADAVRGADSNARLAERILGHDLVLDGIPTVQNLYNPANKQVGRLVATNGQMSSIAGWAATEFIPVEPGTQYTISASGPKRVGASFFTVGTGTLADHIPGSYSGGAVDAGVSLTLTAPPGAGFLAVNVQSPELPEPSQVQIEAGNKATAFVPYGIARVMLPDSASPGLDARVTALEGAGVPGAALVMPNSTTPGSTRLSVPLGASTLEWRLSPFLPPSHTVGYLWNFHSYALDGVVQSVNSADDIAPYRMMGRTIGANHGFRQMHVTVNGHGKGLVDVGSIWTDGANQWVIVDVPAANTIAIASRLGDLLFISGTLTHVSGATNTGSFTPSAVVAREWFPAHNNRQFSAFVDGLKALPGASTSPRHGVTFCESYDVPTKESVIEWLITQAGTPTQIYNYPVAAAVSVSHAYSFDTHGGMTVAADFLARTAVPVFQDVMFVQAFWLGVKGGVLKYLIPDTLPLTHEGVPYDFSKPVSMIGWAPATRLDFTPARIANPSVWPDRVVQFNGDVGLAVGYLPVRDAAPSVRPTLAARKALQISDIGKIYMSAIDSPARTSLAAGDYFSVIGYRVFFKLSANRTASYVVRSPEADWLFVDWHATVVDRVPLPPDLHGRSYTLHRKTAGVTIRSAHATESLVFDVVTTAGAGQYAILRFPK